MKRVSNEEARIRDFVRGILNESSSSSPKAGKSLTEASKMDIGQDTMKTECLDELISEMDSIDFANADFIDQGALDESEKNKRPLFEGEIFPPKFGVNGTSKFLAVLFRDGEVDDNKYFDNETDAKCWIGDKCNNGI